MSNNLSRDTGVNLAALHFDEQTSAAEALTEAYEEDPDKIKNFTKLYKEDGLRTFLALQADPDAARKIFEISENYDVSQAHLIFQKFNELADARKNVEAELEGFFTDFESKKQSGAIPEHEKITYQIMKRAAGLLAEYAAKKQEVYSSPYEVTLC